MTLWDLEMCSLYHSFRYNRLRSNNIYSQRRVKFDDLKTVLISEYTLYPSSLKKASLLYIFIKYVFLYRKIYFVYNVPRQRCVKSPLSVCKVSSVVGVSSHMGMSPVRSVSSKCTHFQVKCQVLTLMLRRKINSYIC